MHLIVENFIDGFSHEALVFLDVGEECVELGVTVHGPLRVGDDALQVITLHRVTCLRDQETTTGVTSADHHRVSCIYFVHVASANLQKSKKKLN